MEIYRRDGTLVAVGEDSPQLGTLELLGAQRGNTLAPLPLPSRFNIAPPATPAGEAVNIGQLYAAFAGPIRGGSSNHPTFETAMAMHRVTDAMRQPSDMTRAFHSGKINPSTDMAASAVSQAVPKV
jgi:hypothetical protein